ncbi:ATP-binding cassette domain-containing protein [Azotobacter vinelandii]|uniref:ATP-binding cassette domain-containing protein n=1 Tax=Azotobacter vinelandii TaxID=354 RepID=UPI002664E473|nr:ATP-binding cassette domain-containing protein [Azotobacter vinelandii]WKN22100.1 ATP-binding cassette domain-containing protein [Azotobacter vinelandii]
MNPLLDDPSLGEFFRLNGLPQPQPHARLDDYWQGLAWQQRDLGGWTLDSLADALVSFMAARNDPAGSPVRLCSLQILAGQAKDGTPETQDLNFLPGDVVCIVGPTGSGKSRLLADIECLAQGDTPSRRRVLVNGLEPDPEWRFSSEARLVAQITQNMNFVMDLCVGDFLCLHAESRRLDDPRAAADRVLAAAVDMAGEPFAAGTPLTQLSGGQSRALMIADAALLSPKPIVLIDEIENAGVDRNRALRLFVEKGKIVLLSTHDPLLALSGSRRLVIRNGAIAKVVEASPEDRRYAEELARLDRGMATLREAIRRGQAPAEVWPGLGF